MLCSGKHLDTYFPLNLRTKFLKLKTTPYTSLASSSREIAFPAATPLCILEIRLLSFPALYDDPPEDTAGLLSITLEVALEVEYRDVEFRIPPALEADVLVLVAFIDADDAGR